MGKYIQQAYFPKDQDIVREMWVVGALKHQISVEDRISHFREQSGQSNKPRSNSRLGTVKEEDELPRSPMMMQQPDLEMSEMHSQGPLKPPPPLTEGHFRRPSSALSYYSASEIA
jgi:hypothetical protein